MDDADLAVKHQEQAEKRARAQRLIAKPVKPSASHCIECDEAIVQARRLAVLGVELCIECQVFAEKRAYR